MAANICPDSSCFMSFGLSDIGNCYPLENMCDECVRNYMPNASLSSLKNFLLNISNAHGVELFRKALQLFKSGGGDPNSPLFIRECGGEDEKGYIIVDEVPKHLILNCLHLDPSFLDALLEIFPDIIVENSAVPKFNFFMDVIRKINEDGNAKNYVEMVKIMLERCVVSIEDAKEARKMLRKKNPQLLADLLDQYIHLCICIKEPCE